MPKDPLDVARGRVAMTSPNGLRPDPAKHREARQEYALTSIERFIRRALEEAPPLTDEQRGRLARLLTAEEAS